MLTSDYSYNLPPDRIASRPPDQRGDARLLTLNRQTGQLSDQTYTNLIDYLNPGDVLVLNDTKVIKARLLATDDRGTKRELLLVERHATDDTLHHRVIYRGKLKVDDSLRVGIAHIKVESVEGGGIALISSNKDVYALAEASGSVPLPPYLKRPANATDTERYQTVFARQAGSVAAPTASLNMTPELLSRLQAKGVQICYLTLHVGLGTFLPIRADNLAEHKMHSEYYEIPPETVAAIRTARAAGHRITAVGTTVARTLEYAGADILGAADSGLNGEADIFIYPGYSFQLVDRLITNFHAPDSTVLMLVAAFAGWDNLKAAYDHALAANYQFLSYGDSMVIY